MLVSRGQDFAVRRKSYRAHEAAVARERLALFLRDDVPQPDGAFAVAGCQETPVGRELRATHE